MTMTDTERVVAPSTTAIIEAQAALCAAYPLTDNPYLNAAVNEVCAALAVEAGHPIDGTAAHDAFYHLVDTIQNLDDLNDNPDEYLASMRLPRTDALYDIQRGVLLSDRDTWTQRLWELAR